MENSIRLPEQGFLRIKQIIGDRKTGIPPIIPVSKSTLWLWVKAGKFPAPVKLGPRVTAWDVRVVRTYLNQAES